jgi:hypothetical protein
MSPSIYSITLGIEVGPIESFKPNNFYSFIGDGVSVSFCVQCPGDEIAFR